MGLRQQLWRSGPECRCAVWFVSGELRILQPGEFCAGRIQRLQPGLREPDICLRRALLRFLFAGLVPRTATVDAGHGLAGRLSDLSAARAEPGVSAHGSIPKPIPSARSTLRICISARSQNCCAGRVRRVLHQHEWAQLSQRGGFERSSIAAVFREHRIERRAAEPAVAGIPKYSSRQLSAVSGFFRHFTCLSAIEGSIHFAGQPAIRN